MLPIVTNITDTLVKLATIYAVVYGWKLFMAYWNARLAHLGLEPGKVAGVAQVVDQPEVDL